MAVLVGKLSLIKDFDLDLLQYSIRLAPGGREINLLIIKKRAPLVRLDPASSIKRSPYYSLNYYCLCFRRGRRFRTLKLFNYVLEFDPGERFDSRRKL